MKKLKLVKLLKWIAAITVVAQFNTVNAAPYSTPNYYLCYNKIGGSWNFGRVPNACDVNPWGEPQYVVDNFGPVIFDDHQSITTERKRYMNELHAMLRDATAYYIKQRKPSVSSAEIAAWQRANFAKAHQETYWTHYRNSTDGNIKMIRGDYGHGHGLVQIDDRWHFTKIQDGAGWQIFQNITYGMEIFYDEWQRAATASCVSSPTAWRSRARSAYSAYNGGPTKLCRWTNPYDAWARNDNGFRDKYDSQTWLNYVADVDLITSIDVPCFMEGNAGCTGVTPIDANDPANWPGRQINLASGESCVYSTAGTLECVNNAQDMMCLNIQFGSTSGSLSPDAAITDTYSKTVHEKHACFADAVDGLQTVGKAVTSQIAITMRATPGGSSLNVTSQAGKTYQVLDYVVNDETNQYRYYLIQEGDKQGYIYAGKVSDHANWTIASTHDQVTDVLIAQAGDQITIVPSTGINLRDVPAGTLLANVPMDEVVTVEDVVVQGNDNDIYFKVTYGSDTGYIYAGKVLNGNTLASWTKIYVPQPPVIYPEVSSVIQIINGAGSNLRATPGGTYIKNIPVDTQLYVFDKVVQGTNDYVYYKVTYAGSTGYIYGGQMLNGNTLDNWAKISTVADVADAGQLITNNVDINQRQTAGGTFIQTIPAGQNLTVISHLVRSSNNYVYYQVSYNGQTGYIYSGYLSPASTVDSWTTIH